MIRPDVWVGPDAEAVAREGAHRVVGCITAALDSAPFAAIALAGGGTPRRLYERLRDAPVDWRRVHVGFTDERAVRPDHADSNYRMIHEALLAHVAIPEGNVHRLRGEAADLEAEAARAARELDTLLGRPPRFHSLVLGLGADGHTASLFPGAPALEETDAAVVAVHNPPASPDRLTLTLPVLRAAAQAWVVATGARKAGSVARAVRGADRLPVILARSGRPVTYLLDAAAARGLSE